jgi:pre-mRNA-processing factor 40
MQQFVNEGKIKARTKWKHIYPSLSNDERYLGMLGNPGSNPLELFWDVVDGLDQKLDAKLAAVNDVIRKYNARLQPPERADDEMKIDGDEDAVKPKLFVVGPDTTEGEFVAVVKGESDEVIRKMSDADLKETYQNVSHYEFAHLFSVMLTLM